jgi:transposase InsO family protein
MPWKEQSLMEIREEFCQLAAQEGVSMRELCRRFGISPTTGYEWRQRYQQAGRAGLADRSRRPHASPRQTSAAVEEEVVRIREAHPAWGGRKIRAVLQREGVASPSASTITAILARRGLLAPEEQTRRQQPIRFVAPFPNALWQMDFKGHFPLVGAGRCHPLTVLDDHSRFALGLRALGDEQLPSVQAELVRLFRHYGLPNQILCDNGPPWGSPVPGSMTRLMVWLLHLDVPVIHGRPHHPQTQGKDERFHRTLVTELLTTQSFASLTQAQHAFDRWRQVYNHDRPHEAIDQQPPISRYQPSPRPYPSQLPTIEYGRSEVVRRVTSRGIVKLGGRQYYLGEGFAGYPVALRPTSEEAILQVLFRHYPVARIDRRAPVDG